FVFKQMIAEDAGHEGEEYHGVGEAFMKHATKETIEGLADVLKPIRAIPGLIEKSPWTFYRRSSAFLHFHEDPAGIFADLKVDGEWERLRVNTAREKSLFLKRAKGSAATSASA